MNWGPDKSRRLFIRAEGLNIQQPVALVDFLCLMPQKIPDNRAAFGVCRVKNRLIGDFLGFYARSATNSQAAA
jgi:hypothetical protein